MVKSEHHERFLARFLKEEPVLRAFLLGTSGRTEAADDLLQAVATRLWEKWEEFDPSRPFRPWALGFARMEVLKWRQRLARSKEVLSEEAIVRLSDVADRHAHEIDSVHHFLLECMSALRDKHRGILDMKYGQGLKAAAISDRLGKSVSAVEMMLVRIRKSLRDCIERKASLSRGEA
jgi:RNA polymerase sigma-70 factor (ECF subfamily)